MLQRAALGPFLGTRPSRTHFPATISSGHRLTPGVIQALWNLLNSVDTFGLTLSGENSVDTFGCVPMGWAEFFHARGACSSVLLRGRTQLPEHRWYQRQSSRPIMRRGRVKMRRGTCVTCARKGPHAGFVAPRLRNGALLPLFVWRTEKRARFVRRPRGTMGYPLRVFDPDCVYFVTNRCVQGRLLMTPSSPRVNMLIGGVLAQACARYGVTLFAHVFLSNHFHLLLKAPAGVLPEFMAYFQSNVAREIGRHIDWRGPFWHRRYSAEPVLDDDALVDRLAYLLSHGVKENLTERVADWPGLSSAGQLLTETGLRFGWIDRTAQSKAARRGEPAAEHHFTTWASLRLAVLPCWEHLTPGQRRREVERLISEIEENGRLERGDRNVLGADRVRAQEPHSMPQSVKYSPRPLCHATTEVVRKAFKQGYRAVVDAYRNASAALRAGIIDAAFPPHVFMPPLPHAWRVQLAVTT